MDAGAAADAGAGAGVSKRRAMVTESQSFLSRPRRDDTTGVALHQLIGDVVARFVGPRTPLAAIKTYRSRTFNIAAPAGGVAAKWEGGVECIGGWTPDFAGFMVEAFASTDGDASAVTFVASEYYSRQVFIKLTPQAAAQARAAHTTAAEFAEARRLVRAQLDAWPPFAATTGEWSRERKSKPPAMTDVELEGGPLVALGLVLPELVGAAAGDLHLFSVPGCEMTELRKKRICTVHATKAGKAFLKDQIAGLLLLGNQLSIDGPMNMVDIENPDMGNPHDFYEMWFENWPTTPSLSA